MIQHILSSVLCSVLISMSAFADIIQIGGTRPAILQNIEMIITSECNAAWQSTYPGNKELLLACPNLAIENLMATVANKLSNSLVVKVESADTSFDPLLMGLQVNADEFATIQSIAIPEGAVNINARLTVLAVEK